MSIHAEISSDLAEKAAALAAESGQSAQEIIDRVLRNGLDAWEREYRLVKEGLDQAERGEFVSAAELERIRNKYRPEV